MTKQAEDLLFLIPPQVAATVITLVNNGTITRQSGRDIIDLVLYQNMFLESPTVINLLKRIEHSILFRQQLEKAIGTEAVARIITRLKDEA